MLDRPSSNPWHAQPVDTVLEALSVDPALGLADAEVAERRATAGDNLLLHARSRGPFALLVAQFRDVTVLVLVGAATIASLIGERIDTVAILAVVGLNALLGFVQEYRAERALAALRTLAAPTARVRRDGHDTTVPAAALVPGDIVRLAAGQIIPADLRLLTVHALRVDEAALTGESVAMLKAILPVPTESLMADQQCMAFKGTTVRAGRAVGVVVATGTRTQLGRIASLLTSIEDARSPLQQRLARLGRQLAVVVLTLCLGLLAAGLLRGEPAGLMFMTALSLAVAAIPEALPAVITISLALGARRLAGQQALMRRLSAVETLGSVTYICADKTGTLTENRMHVASVCLGDGTVVSLEQLPAALAGAPNGAMLLALCTDVTRAADGTLVGDPTETALVDAARRGGVDVERLQREWPRIDELPFTSERARMTTLHAHHAAGGRSDVRQVLACTKGAPECVIPGCTQMTSAAGPVALNVAQVMATTDAMAAAGLRVLALAVRLLRQAPSDPADAEQAQLLVGLVGLLDPPRAEARDAVRTCQRAGIRVVMITGDHPATARAMALRLGILEAGDDLLTGAALRALDDAALAARMAETRVFARVAAEDKMRLVAALQARGEIVAMTGDGVNDAPALQRANIGVAMGREGTDVAREAAHMVLLDDNFATIVQAVREGRRIYDNIRRFVRFVLATNAGEICTLFLAPFLGLPLPLLPVHILWMNLVTDGLPGLALSAEGEEAGGMDRPPRPPGESLFARGLWQHALWVGLLMAMLALGTQAWALHQHNPRWQTMTFTVLTLSQLAHVLAIRSEARSAFTIGWRSNPALLGTVLLTTTGQLMIIYVPQLTRIFRTVPLRWSDLALCLAVSTVVFLAVEVEKVLRRR